MTCARYESYLQAVDSGQLERERKRYDQAAKDAGADEAQAGIAKKKCTPSATIAVDHRMAQVLPDPCRTGCRGL